MPRKVDNKPPHPTVSKKAITIFTKTPIEHLEQYQCPTTHDPKRNAWGAFLVPGSKGILPKYALASPPPGHIRVKWHYEFDSLDCVGGDLEANVLLEPNGDLNLVRIQNMWGMDKCVPIDPWRMKRFEPTGSDVVTALAIHCLKDHRGHIRLVEAPSDRVRKIRNVRWSVIMFYRACRDMPYGVAFLLLLLYLMYWYTIPSFLKVSKVWLGLQIR